MFLYTVQHSIVHSRQLMISSGLLIVALWAFSFFTPNLTQLIMMYLFPVMFALCQHKFSTSPECCPLGISTSLFNLHHISWLDYSCELSKLSLLCSWYSVISKYKLTNRHPKPNTLPPIILLVAPVVRNRGGLFNSSLILNLKSTYQISQQNYILPSP